MFQTFSDGKIIMPVADPDVSTWSYVELLAKKVWFFIDFQTTESKDHYSSSYMVNNSSKINELIDIPTASITAVQIVSPSHVNGTDSWKMEPLIKVSAGMYQWGNDDIYVEIYELKNGHKYYSNRLPRSICEIKNIKVILDLYSL